MLDHPMLRYPNKKFRCQTSNACLTPHIQTFYLYPDDLVSGLPIGGDEEDRTLDPLLAKQVLSQLSYAPV